MPINRTPWTALVDDDGSNLVGTIWNKDKIKTVLLDPIDTITRTSVTTASTGTVHNFNPGIVGHTLVTATNTADLTITGLAPAAAAFVGQTVLIQATGTAPVLLAHANSGSTAANRLTNQVTSGATPIMTRGWALYQFNGTAWALVGHEQGAWIRPAYSAARYVANVGSWTVEVGDENDLAYYVAGAMVFYVGYLNATSVTGAAANIGVTLPNGYITARGGLSPAVFAPNAANEVGFVSWNPALTAFYFQKVNGAAIGPTTNTTYAYWNLAIPIT